MYKTHCQVVYAEVSDLHLTLGLAALDGYSLGDMITFFSSTKIHFLYINLGFSV